MEKDLLLEQELLEVINREIEEKWAHKDCHCRVSNLRKASLPDRNWEIDTSNTGGTTRNYSGECEELRQSILIGFAAKYDVSWPQTS